METPSYNGGNNTSGNSSTLVGGSNVHPNNNNNNSNNHNNHVASVVTSGNHLSVSQIQTIKINSIGSKYADDLALNKRNNL